MYTFSRIDFLLSKLLHVHFRHILMDNHYHAHQEYVFTLKMMYKMETFLMMNQSLVYKIRKFWQQEMCQRCKVRQKDTNHQRIVLCL